MYSVYVSSDQSTVYMLQFFTLKLKSFLKKEKTAQSAIKSLLALKTILDGSFLAQNTGFCEIKFMAYGSNVLLIDVQNCKEVQ